MVDETNPRGTSAPRVALLAAVVVASATACGDDPFSFRWDDTPVTVQIFSLARPELNLSSGFSFFDGRAVRVEAPGSTGGWDVAVDTQGQEIVLLPPGALGISARARVAPLPGILFSDIAEAPEDTAVYIANDPVPVDMNTVYVVRTNRRRGSFSASCVYYAKLEPVDIDVAGGSLTFRYVSSPICNSRDLVPPN